MGMDISTKTLRRDVDHLSSARIPIYEEKIGNTTVYKLNKFRINRMSFTVQELLSLHLLREMVKPYEFDEIGKNANIIINTLISKLPESFKQYVEKSSNIINVCTRNPFLCDINNDVLLTILKASSECKSINIEYHSFTKNEKSKRRIDPYQVTVRDGAYYVYAFCHYRKQLRTFRVSRISKAKITEEEFKKTEFDFEKLQSTSFENLHGDKEYRVKIRFKGEKARFLKEYDSHRAEKITDEKEGSTLFERTVYELQDIKKWVLGYGSGVEVLEPKELRDLVKKEAEEILKNNF